MGNPPTGHGHSPDRAQAARQTGHGQPGGPDAGNAGPGAGSRTPPVGSAGQPGQQVVEFAQLDALDKGRDLGPGVDEGGALRVPRVADRELTGAQAGHLDTRALRVAETALTPDRAGQFRRGHSVVGVHMPSTSSSIVLKMPTERSGDSLSTLRRSITSVYRSTSSRLSRYRALVSCSR